MNGRGTFVSPNGDARPHVRPHSNTSTSSVDGGVTDDVAALTTPDNSFQGRRGGKRPDPISLMLMQMKDEASVREHEREERRLEQEERAAERASDRNI